MKIERGRKIVDTLKIIENELIEVGIDPRNYGFYYLMHAINYYLENGKEFCEVSITKELYPYVACRNGRKNVPPSRVERCIRQSIGKLYNETCTDLLSNMINYKTGKPSNSTFIAYLLIRVKNKINDGSN